MHPGIFGVNHRYPYEGFGMWDPAINERTQLFDPSLLGRGFNAVRFPGGLVANTYHWKRAIGPLSRGAST